MILTRDIIALRPCSWGELDSFIFKFYFLVEKFTSFGDFPWGVVVMVSALYYYFGWPQIAKACKVCFRTLTVFPHSPLNGSLQIILDIWLYFLTKWLIQFNEFASFTKTKSTMCCKELLTSLSLTTPLQGIKNCDGLLQNQGYPKDALVLQ